MTGFKGKDGGLVLVLDMNEDRSLSFGVSSHPEIGCGVKVTEPVETL